MFRAVSYTHLTDWARAAAAGVCSAATIRREMYASLWLDLNMLLTLSLIHICVIHPTSQPQAPKSDTATANTQES